MNAFRVSTLLFLIVLAVATPALADLRVVTTTTDLAELVRAIGGDRVRVEAICQGHQDPHHVQARPSYMVTVSRADLVVAVGLELEVGWLPALLQGARNPRVNPGNLGYLESADAIEPIEVPAGAIDRSQGDLHPLGNPHYWLDPENAKAAAMLIAARMAELDPDSAAYYQENLQRFVDRIDRAMNRWQEAMAPYAGTRIVSYHRTFNYFFDQFGLVGSGYVEDRPGIPPSPAHLARLIRMMTQQDIPVIFHESFYDRSTSDMVSSRTNARVLVLPTSVGGAEAATGYEELIDVIVDSFTQAMGER
ncbi:MAG: zinc ABC transporter substrate-binding protein [Bradymonadales bacterium]|nr:zinc ABC transporter substrate-binding protein [Bradymonadales bacterium]